MAEPDRADLSGVPPDPGYREYYPWHAESWRRITQDLSRLPHALLLHGSAGLGKHGFAWRLANLLLCLAPSRGEPCATCASCLRFAAGTHPDLMPVSPVEDSRVIAIDQIRAVREFVTLKPHTSGRKIVIIEPAEAMNLNAANALLKVLEEPPAASLLILVTPNAARLPATLRSRCTAIVFRMPEAETALQWLQREGVTDARASLTAGGGAPLLARSLARSSALSQREQMVKDIGALQAGEEDALRCATRWKAIGAGQALEWLQIELARQIRTTAGSDKKSNYLRDLFRFMDVISEARAQAEGGLDEGLLLEDILLRWSRISRRMV